jgi:curved DNA-binding protein CbpA
MAGARTLYDILNVSADAEPVVIEAAYRALMKKYHPDQGVEAVPEAPSAASINHAFSILRDAERRTQYDHLEWTRQQNMHLAQYQPPAPRQPRVFGWGGWVIALLLAGVILLMARDREDLAMVAAPGSDLASAAHASVPQTDDTGEGSAGRSLPSFLKSNAPEREVDRLRSAANASSAHVADMEARAYVSAKARLSPPPKRKARPGRRHAGQKQIRREKDFLEREDYIY